MSVTVCISHDVDHLSVREHWHDLIVPKFLVRTTLESWTRRLPTGTGGRRFQSVFLNDWNNLPALVKYDAEQGVKSTFFFGMANGLGLAYSYEAAGPWMTQVRRAGLDLGLHGIAYDNVKGMITERGRFAALMGEEPVGIRMHYLRFSPQTPQLLTSSGYRYDCSIRSSSVFRPYCIGGLVEFPLHLMDSDLFYGPGHHVQSGTLRSAQECTLRAFDVADSQDGFVSCLLHQRHFSEPWSEWREWYMWLVELIRHGQGIQIKSYAEMLDEFTL